MYNVLHIMAGADAGGISTVVLNYYRAIDRAKIHFDVAVTTDMIGVNASELEKLGANIYQLPLKSKGIKAFEKALSELLCRGSYQAVHVHENETSYVALRIAKKLGIAQRIAHAHTSSPYISPKSELKRLSGCIFNSYYATNVIGCGKLAGERIFGKWNMRRKKACVLPNAINLERFVFDEVIRRSVRKKLSVENQFVIGMVGRLSDQKNHKKALDIMNCYQKTNPNAVLICVGDGELEQKIQEDIDRRGLNNCVRLIGKRTDVNHLYMGFDVLLMPSKFEGFPVAAVEAIASGLPVLLSDTITRELETCRGVRYLPINGIDPWLDALDAAARNMFSDRTGGCDVLKANGLDITQTAKQLEAIYLRFGE